ncbi:hypothetical protein AAFF_G00254850, partial [Aldrovandia affinis]
LKKETLDCSGVLKKETLDCSGVLQKETLDCSGVLQKETLDCSGVLQKETLDCSGSEPNLGEASVRTGTGRLRYRLSPRSDGQTDKQTEPSL